MVDQSTDIIEGFINDVEKLYKGTKNGDDGFSAEFVVSLHYWYMVPNYWHMLPISTG